MIQISNLTKIYKSKKKNNCKALDNVTLTLPNSGLVFVLGKSGSGKSTLLNLIGGLDNITSGTITVDGNNISNFKEKEFCDYRNTHIGFIFQDYHLIDELTVYDNIVLSLNLRRIEDKQDVLNALKKVDLEGYENRYPTELSGGERQRVAIARAIVKKPRIILADEPTGNLDTNTATVIIQILKELSKECLILIVSHNIIDANKCADRIIELSKGKIVSDKSKNPNYNDNVVYDNNTLYYPYDKVLDVNDITVINENISNSNKMVIVEDKFISTNIEKVNEDKIIIEKKKLKLNKELKLSLKFLKNKIFNISLSSFMVSAIMIILALAQTIINFDSGQIISNEMIKTEQTSVLFDKQMTKAQKNNTNNSYNVCVDSSDLQAFENSSYSGNIYEVLSYSVPVASSTNSAGIVYNYFQHGIFINETFGTMIVDDTFLTKKFNELTYVAKLDEFHPLGVLITDYVADGILALNSQYKGKQPKDILGKYSYGGFTTNRIIINGIIKTDYKKRYENLFEQYALGKIKDVSKLTSNEEFIRFSNELYDSLGYSYSLNPNLLNDFVGNKDIQIMWHYKLMFNKYEFSVINGESPNFTYSSKFNLKDDEIIMNLDKYNTIFDANYTNETAKDFIAHTVNLSQYYFYDYANENALFNKKVKIVGLSNSFKSTAALSENLYTEFSKNVIMVTGLYFYGVGGMDEVLDLALQLDYQPSSYTIEGVHTMTKAVDVFIPIFELIALVLCVGIVLILVSFSSKMIKDKMHEIGILKALGTQNSSITSVFGLQVVMIALLTILMSTIGYFFFIDLANDVLIESLKQLAPSHIVLDLDFLTFKIDIALTNMLLILALALVSLLVPMLKIKSIKPVKIIKAKE